MKKSTIKVTLVEVNTDPRTSVYQLEIITPAENSPGGSWNETFNTEDQLRHFLRGLRVATTMSLNMFDMASVWAFDPESCVKELP
jgi:hypothetical protein